MGFYGESPTNYFIRAIEIRFVNRQLLIIFSSIILLSVSAAASHGANNDLVVDGDSSFISGNFERDEVRVVNGGTLYVNGKATIQAHSFYVDSSSRVYGDGRGNSGGSSSGAGDGERGSGPGEGGGGGGDDTGPYDPGYSGSDYGSRTSQSIRQGSGGGAGGDGHETDGGGYGGDGGAALRVNATSIDVDGTITMDGAGGGSKYASGDGGAGGGGAGYGGYGQTGENGVDNGDSGGSGGGGSGGGILLIGPQINISGDLSADGGNGDNTAAAGGDGGGGRIKIFYGALNEESPYYSVSGHRTGTIYKEFVNYPPSISNPAPSGGTVVDTSPVLSADYSDLDGDNGQIYFFDGDQGFLDRCSVMNGGSCGIEYISASETCRNYEWYAKAGDGIENSTMYGPYTFQSQCTAPETPFNPDPSDGETGIKKYTNISATFRDFDSSSGTLKFFEQDDTFIGSCSTTNNSRCQVNYSSASDEGAEYSWYAEAEDPNGTVSPESNNWSFTTNSPPFIADPVPENAETGLSPKPNVSAVYRDADAEEGQMTIYAEDGTFIGSCSNMVVGERCEKKYSSADSFTETYEWETRVSDGNTWVSETWSFETRSYGSIAPSYNRVRLEFESASSSFNMVKNSSRTVSVRVENRGTEKNISLGITEGAGFSRFASGTGPLELRLGNETETVTVILSPDSAGDKTLELTADNTDLGVSKSISADIRVDNNPIQRSNVREVPGLSMLNIILLSLVSSYFILK